QIQTRLREQSRVGVEFADPAHIIASITLADDDASVDALLTALRRAAATSPEGSAPTQPVAILLPPIPPMALTPREAFGRPTQAVPLEGAVGRICGEQVMPYPPGIPVLLPGEVVGAEHVDFLTAQLAHGVRLVGPEDPGLSTLRVCV
ncbi:MAG TPA: hypothetical protein PK954_18960, partial [Anaerolineales bacterium]|nr:hypothetical protein [Anaerolineales bacterium]